MEYIADKKNIGAKTLFATHYHELTELEGKTDGVNNFCVTVKENAGDIVFLRKIERGGAMASYGIHVAKLAGVPADVIKRSGDLLNALNSSDINRTRDLPSAITSAEMQPNVPQYDDIIETIKNLDADGLTPRMALDILYDLKKALR